MSSSMKATIHLGLIFFEENLVSHSNWYWNILKRFLNVSTIESTSPSWTRSTLSHHQVIQWTKAKVRVCSDSVLCLGEAIRGWEGQVAEFQMSAFYGEVLGIDGGAIELKWIIFPGFTSLQIL